jgi:RNA polymerase sigma-70 factor (ECF subfamily)
MRAEVEQAIQLLSEKSPGSLEKAVSLLQQTVFAFSMRVCGHREDAEDTMQDVLVKSLPHLSNFDNAKALVVWLYTVAKNQCLMSRRRSKFAPKQELSLEELMPTAPELERLGSNRQQHPDEVLIRKENADVVRQAVLRVPPQYRLVLVLHDMEGLDTNEVAQVTGLRPGTVRVRLHRARLFLRRELAGAPRHKPRRRAHPAASSECKNVFAALSDYIDSQLAPASCAEIREHMAGCAPCIAFLDDLQRSISRVQAVPPDRPDALLAAEIRKRLMPLIAGRESDKVAADR